MKKIVWIKGAYGPHNLGDDLLYTLIHRNISSRLGSKFEVVVGVDNINKAKRVNEKIKYKDSCQRVQCDYLVLGGGGQFYSFNNTDRSYLSKIKFYINSIFNLKIHHLLLRKILRDKFSFKVGFCVGVGPFHNKNDKIQVVESIRKFDYFSVRDSESEKLLQSHGISPFYFTDPVFSLDAMKIKSKGDRIGIILRDWKKDSDGKNVIGKLESLAINLRERNHSIEIVLLSEHDKDMLSQELSSFPVWVWNADENPEGIVENWCERYNTIITTRAHGVLIGALAGCNVIVAPLESKLKNFHLFFPNSTHYIEKKSFLKILPQDIEDKINNSYSVEKRNEEIEYNKKIADMSFDSLCDWIKKTNA
ncbi:polysaccharide pyruvyl transferase family protein [Vibrio diabolicus]|uniref:polysaccharide pyruvyl transferase family protein n=2 Tax=Vibrio harveyi group TaxID=717610 RepID=UPI0015948743|nr:polysaccharide pyruvyl transferase family protein [Vibrio diabolicus]NVC48671.1 hypothetical protein [Vibrio diabolicus]